MKVKVILPADGHMLWKLNNSLIREVDQGQGYNMLAIPDGNYAVSTTQSKNPYYIKYDGTKVYAVGDGPRSQNYKGETVYREALFIVSEATLDLGKDINIIGSLTIPYTEPETKKITILNNIVNATVSPTQIELGKETQITITASDGYHFSSAPTINTNDSTIETTLDSTNKIATATTTLSDTTTEVQINGETVSDPVLISITNNISNTTIEPTSVELGKETTVTISADENYSFSEAPTVKINDSTILNTTLSSDKKSATLTNTFDSSTTSISIEGSVNEDEIKLPITLEEYENCTINPTEITLGQRNTLILTANRGASFEEQPYLTTSDGTRKVFTLSDNNKTGTLTSYFDKTEKKITLFATAVKSETTDYNPFVAIFVPTLNQIKTLGNIAQINPDSSGDLNLTQYIYGLYKVFVDVPTETEEKDILLGKYNTNIKAKICNKEIIEMFTVDSIYIPFRNTQYPVFDNPPHIKAKLFLPCIGVVDLSDDSIQALLNFGTQRIHYICNLLSMQCNAFIEVSPTSSESDYVPVQFFTGEIGYNYPFVQGKQYSKLDFNTDNIFQFTDIYPKLITIKDEPYRNGNNYIGYPIKHYENLNDLVKKGYFEISHVKMPDNSQITDTERDELIRILGEGVYF